MIFSRLYPPSTLRSNAILEGGTFLLCSDGLTRVISNSAISGAIDEAPGDSGRALAGSSRIMRWAGREQ